MVGIPFRMFDTPASIREPPPTLGQHSREILSGQLGIDDDELAKLVADGVTTL